MNTENMYHRQVAVLTDGREGNDNTVVNKVITGRGCYLQFVNRAMDISIRAGVDSAGAILYCIADVSKICELPANQTQLLVDRKYAEKRQFLPAGRGCRPSYCIQYEDLRAGLLKITTGTLMNTLLIWLAKSVHPYLQDWLETQGDDASCFELDSKCTCEEPVKPKRKYTRRKASEDVAPAESVNTVDVSSDEHEETEDKGQQAFSWFTASSTANSSWKKKDEIPEKRKVESSSLETRVAALEKEIAELKEFVGKLKAAAAAINL